MADGFTQETRVGKLTTPLGVDALLLSRFRAEEELSQVHPFHIEAMSPDPDIDFDKALGQNCSITLIASDNLERDFCGVLVEAEFKGERDGLFVFQLELRPWLWLLNHASSTRIFENLTAPDIIKKVFQSRGFADFQDALTVSYPTLTYCVQYNETDFNFVSRLMEENGIYYYHKHSDSKHELVLADSRSSHHPAPGVDTIFYSPDARGGIRLDGKQGFHRWTKQRKFTTGKVGLNAYDYTKPSTSLKVDSDQSGKYANGSLETYFHPGAHIDSHEGERLARVLIDSKKAADQRRRGHGSAPSLFPGCVVTLADHPDGSENIEYLVLHCSHEFNAQGYRSRSDGVGSSLGAAWAGGAGSGGGSGGVDAGIDDPAESPDQNYKGSVGMSDSGQPFRAPSAAKIPRIAGADVGIVIGSGEIDTDPQGLGRIQVMFPTYETPNNTFWARTSQFWAGAGQRGVLFLPRVGDEVIVVYERGDPSRPIVVGSFYNGNDKPPVDLPAKKNVSLIRTLSTPGGGGYHLISFDDTADSELMSVQAQKDLSVLVLNDETRTVDHNQTVTVQGDAEKTTGGGETVEVGKSYSVSVGQNYEVEVGKDYDLAATEKITLTAGMGSSITISPEGITIEAPMVTINGHTLVTING
jgi:type VI secretion system secreted protein VgrG